MKVYRLEVMVLDFEDCGEESIIHMVENLKYVSASVMDSKSVDIGKWDDRHPLNCRATSLDEFRRLFPGVNAPLSSPSCS